MKYIKWLAVLGFLAGIIAFCHWQNNGLVVTELEFRSQEVPSGFWGFRIAHVSDLHNKEFGQGNADLLAAIEAANPDIIVITGDIIDSRRTKVSIALDFVQGAAGIAPVYYVSGNHERSVDYDRFSDDLAAAGAMVLNNTGTLLEKGQDRIAFLGVADPVFIQYEYDYLRDDRNSFFSENLAAVAAEYEDDFKILLSHRPEKMSLYTYHGMDLVFSGHAHGGQFRLPLVGGLVAPEQGFFPKYDGGIYQEGETSMVVSRGLGNSIFPLRLFNRPELVVVTLQGD